MKRWIAAGLALAACAGPRAQTRPVPPSPDAPAPRPPPLQPHAFLASRASPALGCFRREQKRNPALEGRVTLKLLLDTDAAVARPLSGDGALAASIARCLNALMARGALAIPRGAGDTEVTFTVVFARAP